MILIQNARSTSRRIGGRPGERIAGRPVTAVAHPGGLPTQHLRDQVLRRPPEFTQYTSIKLTTRLVRAGIEASMGSVGDSYDNALAENLWMLIKTECIRGRASATRAEANLALFEYIDGFYNPRRIQKRLGYLSPIEFEEKHYANQPTAEPVSLKPRKPALTS
ncbi:IS3 family transposase [Streptomyces sp. NBS 14/10]|uniref:IS3 family transposase n=1 Tax=Streptomyces sp. NBS 14/10 TaxID=1945643 RepID=UPI002730A88D|nr:IS3 family transposase [Streptomyces sp. NBS 14/10]KAK1177979.1 IS3 family transposase [Streptomyces sp. NBS 14/10]